MINLILCLKEQTYKLIVHAAFVMLFIPFNISASDVTPLVAEKKNKTNQQSDPLGQQPRINQSIPKSESHLFDPTLTSDSNLDPEIIKRVQLALLLNEYYSGDISGELTKDTIASITRFKQDNLIITSKLLDAYTFTSLGIFKSHAK